MLFKTALIAIVVAVAVAAPCDDHKDPHPVKAPRCSPKEFYYSPKSCCLPRGGPHHPSNPPPRKRCPSKDWYWSNQRACCVPYHPNPAPPRCDRNWQWNSHSFCCEPHGHFHHPIPGKDYPIKPLPKPKHRPTSTTTVTVTVTPSPTPVSQCNTGGTHCCNQVQSSTDSDATKVLDAFGVKIDNTKTGNNQTNIGINCSPVSGTGANCIEQPVCCQNNNFSGGNGSIIIGCSPINIFINVEAPKDNSTKPALP